MEMKQKINPQELAKQTSKVEQAIAAAKRNEQKFVAPTDAELARVPATAESEAAGLEKARQTVEALSNKPEIVERLAVKSGTEETSQSRNNIGKEKRGLLKLWKELCTHDAPQLFLGSLAAGINCLAFSYLGSKLLALGGIASVLGVGSVFVGAFALVVTVISVAALFSKIDFAHNQS